MNYQEQLSEIKRLDPEYFRAAIKRLYNHVSQLNAFIDRPVIEVNGIELNEYIKQL